VTFSGLATRTYSTQQQSSRQGATIDMVICHHAATTNAEQVIAQEVSGSREVSSNYVITNTGEIVGIVPEEYRAWTSGSSSDGGKGAAYDRRSITFECADERNGDPWPISAASQQAIVNLLVDVHQRYGIPLDRDHVVGHRELYTRWGASYATACPGGMNVDDLVNRARAAVGQPPVAPIAGGVGRRLPTGRRDREPVRDRDSAVPHIARFRHRPARC
jgi:N-acetyl-anhydromuramyl-L-alanine amidase AmpD